MLKVGLTGGIACGKTYTLRQFQKLGVHAIDADEIAHRVIEPGQPAYQEILDRFGRDILGSDGSIDRKKLGSRVFSDDQALQELNRIVHPHVFAEEQREITEYQARFQNRQAPILMVDAALMVETGSYRSYDYLIVVYCHPEIQLQRLMTRDGLSEDEALKRIHTQMPLLEKIKFGDYIIENSGKLANTVQQIKQTHAELIERYDELNPRGGPPPAGES